MYIPAVLLSVWVVSPVHIILTACFTTDIISNVCIPVGIFNNVAAEKAVAFSTFVVLYLLPLALMIFCYSCIVYKLRTKVSTLHVYDHLYKSTAYTMRLTYTDVCNFDSFRHSLSTSYVKFISVTILYVSNVKHQGQIQDFLLAYIPYCTVFEGYFVRGKLLNSRLRNWFQENTPCP